MRLPSAVRRPPSAEPHFVRFQRYDIVRTMSPKRTLLLAAALAAFLVFAAMPAAAADAAGHFRRVVFAPASPAAGRPVLFTASGFRTPGLLKWDMGDGTVLVTGGQAAPGDEATLSYVYAVAGTYLVKVFDDGGRDPVPATAVVVEVSAAAAPPPPTAPPGQEPGPAEPAPPTRAEAPPAAAPQPPAASSAEAPVAAAPVEPTPDEDALAPRSRGGRPFIKLGPFAGWFQPRDAWVRKIYGDGGMLYGARVGLHLWKGFYLWIGAAHVRLAGATTLTGETTAMTLLPASAFLRFHATLGFLRPYAGIGYTYLGFLETSSLGETRDWVGNVAYEAGLEVRLHRHLFLDLGARYDELRVSPTGFEVDLGGLQGGAALLLSF